MPPQAAGEGRHLTERAASGGTSRSALCQPRPSSGCCAPTFSPRAGRRNRFASWSITPRAPTFDFSGLPRSRLYERGYLSIGCAPCTRAVGAGEPARAGRWWWEDPEHKECGLHQLGVPRPAAQSATAAATADSAS